jgi:hypothetical protein
MESPIIATLFVVTVLLLGVGLVYLYSSESTVTLSQINPLELASSYSQELLVSSSPISINYVIPTERGIPLNLSENFLLYVNIPNYTGNLLLVPFLASPSVNPYSYVPSPIFSGYINLVNEQSQVGYVNVSPSHLVNIQTDVNLLGQDHVVDAHAFVVKPGTVNVTFVTNGNQLLIIWVLANISGHLYRIGYTYFPTSKYINTIEGALVPPISPGLISEFEQKFGGFSIMFFSSGGNIALGENSFLNAYNGLGNIGVNSSGPLTISLEEHSGILSQWLNITSNVKLEGVKNDVVPRLGSSVTPNVSPSLLFNPIISNLNILNAIKSFSSQKYTSEKNLGSGPQSSLVTFSSPVIFSSNVQLGPGTYVFNAPVIFSGPVTIGGDNKGPVNLVFKEGALFNGSSLAIDGSSLNITSNGPLLFNLTTKSSEFTVGESSNINITSTGPVFFQANQLEFGESSVLQINSPLPTYVFTPASGSVSFDEHTLLNSSNGLIIEGASQVSFGEHSSLLANGFLFINSSDSVQFSENSAILVNGPSYIVAPSIDFEEHSQFIAYLYSIFNSSSVSFGEHSLLYVTKLPLGNGLTSMNAKPLFSLISPGVTLNLEGWVYLLPNNQSVNIINYLITSDKGDSIQVLASVSPTVNGYLNLTIEINGKPVTSYMVKPLEYYFFNITEIYSYSGSYYNVGVSTSLSTQYGALTPSQSYSPHLKIYGQYYYPLIVFGNESFVQLMFTNNTGLNGLLWRYGPLTDVSTQINSQQPFIAYYYLISPMSTSTLVQTQTNNYFQVTVLQSEAITT